VSSGGLESPGRRYHLARSSVIFWRRYASWGNPVLILLFRLASGLKLSARLLWHRQIASLRAYWQGLLEGWVTQLK
jgi:hypothetical protein